MKRTLENKKYTEKMIDEKLIKRALQLFIRFLKEEKLLVTFNRNVSQFLKEDSLTKYIKYNNSYSKYVFDLAAKSYCFHVEDIYCIFLNKAMIWNKNRGRIRILAKHKQRMEEILLQ